MKNLKDLGYISIPDEHKELLSRHLHGLNYKSYSFKGEIKHGRCHSYSVGIYSDYYIHYVRDITISPDLYDLFSHDIPKAVPIKIENLISTAYFDFNNEKGSDPELASLILKHLHSLGWTSSILVSKLETLKNKYVSYYLNFMENTYKVHVLIENDTYLIRSVSIVEKQYFKEDYDFSNTLPTTTDIMKLELLALDERRNKLSSMIK
jgi:hypothetical protein